MKRIFDEVEVDGLPAPAVDFDAIIPAAGRGSRLGAEVPKILYPILGRPILHWLAERLLPRSARLVLVVSPSGEWPIRQAVDRMGLADRFALAVQPEPRGMGDAILSAAPLVRSKHTLVVWGDQVTLRGATLDRMVRLHASRPAPKLTVATILRQRPYIHLARDGEGRIVRVYEARKGPIPVDGDVGGENDCGVFAFEAQALFDELRRAQATHPEGQEFDLLPLFPRFEVGDGAVATLRLSDENETLGVNTREDASKVEAFLRRDGARDPGQ